MQLRRTGCDLRIICPHNIVAGGATMGLIGCEGEVMRRTVPACAYAGLGGLVVLAMVRMGG